MNQYPRQDRNVGPYMKPHWSPPRGPRAGPRLSRQRHNRRRNSRKRHRRQEAQARGISFVAADATNVGPRNDMSHLDPRSRSEASHLNTQPVLSLPQPTQPFSSHSTPTIPASLSGIPGLFLAKPKEDNSKSKEGFPNVKEGIFKRKESALKPKQYHPVIKTEKMVVQVNEKRCLKELEDAIRRAEEEEFTETDYKMIDAYKNRRMIGGVSRWMGPLPSGGVMFVTNIADKQSLAVENKPIHVAEIAMPQAIAGSVANPISIDSDEEDEMPFGTAKAVSATSVSKDRRRYGAQHRQDRGQASQTPKKSTIDRNDNIDLRHNSGGVGSRKMSMTLPERLLLATPTPTARR